MERIQKFVLRIISGIRRERSSWYQFKLSVTNPPSYSGHFNLIKRKLIPIARKFSSNLWITNYHNRTSDEILFRLKSTKTKVHFIKKSLNELKRNRSIYDWEISSWNPLIDATNRIEGSQLHSHLPLTFLRLSRSRPKKTQC